MSFKDHFSGVAAGYAAYRPSYPSALAERLAAMCGRHELAVDVGCGTGQLSVSLGEHFARVEASDASAEQVAKATPHPRVRYRAAPAEALPVGDGTADLISVAQAAHWLDLPRFYAECRRIARPGGVLALITYGILSVEGPPGPVLARFYHDVAGPHWPPERAHVEAGYRTLPFPFDELSLPATGMTAEWTLAELLGYVGTWSALKPLRAAEGEAPLMRFGTELSQSWGDGAIRRRITWPLSGRFGRL